MNQTEHHDRWKESYSRVLKLQFRDHNIQNSAMEDEQEHQIQTTSSSSSIDDHLQLLRSKATELILHEKWTESIQIYSQLLDFCQSLISEPDPNPNHLCRFRKTLCLALSNRAEARFRLRDHSEALRDCDEALKLDGTHFRTLFCKGKILLHLNRYSMALNCFKSALLDPQAGGDLEILNGYVDRCKKLEFRSRTGGFDVSDWVLKGFCGKPPELAEFIGTVEIKRSEISGRGLFATKNVESGTLILVTKAITTERGIVLPGQGSVEHAQLVMWKNFTDKVAESVATCRRTRQLISKLSRGYDEEGLELPCINFFKPETEESGYSDEKLDKDEILNILDVNSLVEGAASAKVLGKNSDYHGVGLWVLASFINHSCTPNVRRLHVGDYVIVHASRDIKAGEELTFMYFDALLPSKERKEMSKTWGFDCKCSRCELEDRISSNQELTQIEIAIERGMDAGSEIHKLEEGMRRWGVKGKEKGFVRASHWKAYLDAYGSHRTMKRLGSRIPPLEVIVDSVVEAVGCEERVLRVAVEGLKKSGSGCVEMERVMNLSKGVYSKALKKQAIRSLLEMKVHEHNY